MGGAATPLRRDPTLYDRRTSSRPSYGRRHEGEDGGWTPARVERGRGQHGADRRLMDGHSCCRTGRLLRTTHWSVASPALISVTFWLLRSTIRRLGTS